MVVYLEKLYVVSVICLLGIIFLWELFNLNFLKNIEVIFLVLVLILGIVLAKGIPFYTSAISLILGHALIFKYQIPYYIWQEGLTKNLPLATIFLMVPVLSIPLREGGYLEIINRLINKNITKTRSTFFAISGLVFCLSSIANLGAVRVLHDLIKPSKLPTRFLGKSYCTGFASCIVWSPYFASVNLVLYYTGVSFSKYFLLGFIYGTLIFFMGNLLFFRDLASQNEVKANRYIFLEPKDDEKSLQGLVLILLGLFLGVIVGERCLNFSSMMLWISLLAAIYATCWSFFIGRFKEFLKNMKAYGKEITQVKNEVVFFLCVGFIGVVLANTPLQGIIEYLFTRVSGYSIFIMVELIILMTVLLAILGVHHVITITALGLSLKAEVLGLSDMGYSLTLIGAFAISMIASPFAPFNIISGGLFGESSFMVSLRYNRALALVLIPFSGVFVIVVNYFT